MGIPTPDFDYRRKFTAAPTTAAITASSTLTGTLTAHVQYRAFNSGTAVAYFLQGGGSTVAVAGTSIPIAAGAYFPDPIFVESGAQRIAVVSTVSSGTLFLIAQGT
jgi:hypothetical protein